MLRSMKEIKGYTLLAKDGEIGSCKDFLFDNHSFQLRYMVADTGSWLPGRKVVLLPEQLGEPDWHTRRLPVEMTKAEIEAGPSLSEHEPVSRRYEQRFFSFYRIAPSATYGGLAWGAHMDPVAVPTSMMEKEGNDEPIPQEDQHLHSFHEALGYRIMTQDDKVGYIDDMIMEDGKWMVRFLVLDTRKWLRGDRVLLPVHQIKAFDFEDHEVKVGFSSNEISDFPPYNPHAPINRVLETRLYDFFGRPHN